MDYQLQFKDIETNMINFIPKGTQITNIKDIAGGNSNTKFRNANYYEEKYEIKANNWIKRVGKIESDKYILDIHWVEAKNGIRTSWKIKNKRLK